MRTMTINIGLGDSSVRKCSMPWYRRLKKALAWVHHNGGASVRLMHHKVPGDRVVEPTLVAQCTIPDTQFAGFMAGLYALANYTEQDCIAVLFPEGYGTLVGPGASQPAWAGGFCRESFIDWAEACRSTA